MTFYNTHSNNIIVILMAAIVAVYCTNLEVLSHTYKSNLKTSCGDCDIESYSYLVSVQHIITFVHVCGGTLMTERWVLTSAFCGEEITDPKLFVLVGGVSRITRQAMSVSQITRIIIYPRYKSSLTHLNNIGLIQIRGPMLKTTTVNYVTLPWERKRANQAELCSTATVIGWRKQIIAKKVQHFYGKLSCVDVKISNNKCTELYGYDIADKVICAERKNYRNSTCFGDPGGPLLCGQVQYGISSWKEECFQNNKLGFYTNLKYYQKFIRDSITSRSYTIFYLQRKNSYSQLIYLLIQVVITYL